MATATCRTDGCENEDVPLEVTTEFQDVDGNTAYVSSVVCGGCGQEIGDVEPPLPPPPEPEDPRPDRPDNTLPDGPPDRPDNTLPQPEATPTEGNER
jgi:hypothetical protein